LGFLDDVTLGGSFSSLSSDVALIESSSRSIGLLLNRSKCEIISSSPPPAGLFFSVFCVVAAADAVLLGSPLLPGPALDAALLKRHAELSTAEKRLSLIAAHDALVLLRSSLSTPKLTHLLRSSPCSGHHSLLSFDNLLRRCVCNISNTDLSDDQWRQASLSVKAGGLGVRLASHLAPSAYLAAFNATLSLQSLILSTPSLAMSNHELSALNAWSSLSSAAAPSDLAAHKQSSWDCLVVEAELNRLLSTQHDKARLLAVSAEHSSDWLHALPISSCGLRLSDEGVRVAVGLRLGASICQPHQCVCGATVTSSGSHALSCKKSSARILRHNALNDLIFRALMKAGVPSVKEPPGLLRADGKRPDGVTQIPWSSGKCLAWDVTVADTLAASYQHISSISAGRVAEKAADMKVAKYAAISLTHQFLPVAFETLGPMNKAAVAFITALGKRLSAASGEFRETAFLFQRLSITIQRYNSVALTSSFPDSAAEDWVDS